MKSNSATKNLINVFGKISNLNLESDKLLNIHKIPNHYQNYKRLSLYFGDWRRIEADCLYLRNRKEFERLLVLSKMANFKVPYNLDLYNNNNTNRSSNTNSNKDKDKYTNNNRELDTNKEEQLLECSDFVKNCKFIYFGSLTKFVPTEHLKSLLIPLDLYSDFYDLEPNNYSYFEGLTDSINTTNTSSYLSKPSSTSSSSSVSSTSSYSSSTSSFSSTSSASSFSSNSKFSDSSFSNDIPNLSNTSSNTSKSNSQSNLYQRGLKNLNNAKTLINYLENMESIDRILLCADNNSTWNAYHKLLKYS